MSICADYSNYVFGYHEAMVKKIAWVVGWCLWIVICYYVAELLGGGVTILLGLSGSGNVLANMLITAFIYILILGFSYGGVFLLQKKYKQPKIEELSGFTRDINWKDFRQAVVYILLYFCILIVVMIGLQLLSPDIAKETQNVGFSTINNSSLELILIFLSLVVVAPIAEELVMRGLLFNRLRSKIPFWLTSIIVSLLFAFAHKQINVAIDTFILSLFLCYTREKTGAIYSPIMMHMMKNLVGFLVLYVL